MDAEDFMQTVYIVRRANLRALADEAGGVGLLAEKAGFKNSAYLSQLFSHRFSEKAARKIEERLGLPFGRLDQNG